MSSRRLCATAVASFEATDESAGRAARRGARRREHELGRSLALACLQELEIPGRIEGSPGGRPRWPARAVGSISHSPRMCVAVVAHSSAVTGIGVDVEPISTIGASAWAEIFTAHEQRVLQSNGPDLATVWFSAKESVLKCSPEAASIRDIELRLGRSATDGGWFACPAMPAIEGRWFQQAAHVFTIAVKR